MNKIILKMVDSKNIYGTMNGASVRYTNITDADKKMIKDMQNLKTLEEVQDIDIRGNGALRGAIFKEHRKAFAEAEGFDWRKMFMADQNNLDGSVFEVTQEYVEANPNGWTDIPEDILMMRKDLKGVAIGHPVADCAVVAAEDKRQGITAVAHCGGEMIDKRIPQMTIEALYREGSKPEDIIVNVRTNLTVLESNADKVNGNVYTWNINDQNYTNKPIYIKIEKERYQEPFISQFISIIVIIITFVMIGILIYFKAIRKHKKNNKIS